MADKILNKGFNVFEPEEEEQDTIEPISGVIAYDDPRVDSPAPVLGDEEDDDPFSFLDEAPLVDVSKTPQQISEEADRQLWFQKKAELENLAPGTSVPEEWVTEFEDPEKRMGVVEDYQRRVAPLKIRKPDVTGAAGLEEGQERQIPSEASIQPKIEGPLAAPLSPLEWLESTPNPAHRDDRGAPTKEGLTAYYNHYRRQLLQQNLLDDKKEQEIRVKYAASMLKHFDLPDSEAEQLLNSTVRNNLSFEGEAKFVEDSLDLKEGAFGKQNETNPIARTNEQFELFNRAKREALERGKFAFATLYDAKTKQYYVGAGNFDKLSLENRNEAIAAAYEALDAGVLDPGDLWRVKYLLSPSGMGTSTIAQAAQNYTLRQDIVNLSTAQGEALYTPKTESIDKLLLAVLNPRAENLGTWWDEDVQGNRPETLNDALQYDTFLKDSQFRGIQKRLVLQDLKKQGRDEEFEAVDKAVLDSEWLEKYIPDERTHKYGVRRLRQMFRELAANHANSTSTFKFFDSPSEYYKNIRVTPMGTVLIAPQLQYRKDWFELALSQYRTKGEETLSDKQIRLLRQQRNNFMEARYEAIDRVLRETSDATAEAWNDAKQANNILSEKSPSKKSKIEVLDEFLLDPENYAAFSSQTGAFLESAWDQGVRGIYHNFAVMLGSESSVQALNEINEKAADRREIARLFGNPYGLGMEVGTQLAPMLLDITVTGVLTVLTGTGGAAYVLAKTGVRAGFKGHTKLLMGRMLAKEIGESSVEATQRVLATGLIKNSSDAATAEGVRKAIKAYNGLVANKLVIAGGTFATAANRSGGGMYVSVYEALKKQNPDKSHEWLHDRSLGPALAGGFLTGLICVGMQGIGKGGMENALLANMPWRKAKGILNSITRTGLRELPDDVAHEALVRITKKRILKVVGSKFPRLLKDMGDEGFEEALDTFLNSFIEDWATGKSSTLGERLMNSWHAFQVGALATSTVPVARAAITKVRGTDVSDPAFFEEEQISGIAKELQKELAQTGSPMTADAIEQLLIRPAGQPRVIEGEVQLDELPEARVPRVPPEQREEHLKEVAEVLKGREPIEGEGPFLDDLPQIDDPELLELAEKDTNYNVNSDGVVLGVRNINNGEWVGQEPDEDAATISRPDVPEGADPNDLRYPSTDLTGDTVTEETVKAETARWADVNKKQLENKGIKLAPTDLNKGNPTGTNAAVVNIGSNNQGKGAPIIQVDFAGLARRLEGVDKKDRYKVFNAILGEELTHAAEIIQFKLEYKKLHNGKEPTVDQLKTYVHARYESMYNDMHVQERRNVVAAYENIEDKDVILPEGATPDRKAQMTKAQIAGEFTRMLLQYESTKTTTESAQWLTSDEVSTFLGGVSDRIGKNLLHKKTGFQGPVRHNLRKHLDRVNSVLVDFVIRKAEQEGVDPDVAKAAAKEEKLIQEIQFDGHREDGTSFSRDWGHVGNSSKKWTSRGKDRDGATMVSRDRKYKLVKRVTDPADARQDTYELINLETQKSEGEFNNQFDAFNKHKELTTTPNTDFVDPDIEPPEPVATTDEDQTYLDLIDNQKISENEEEIQRMVFQAALNPTQIAAVEAHAKAVESGNLDAIQEARRHMGSVGLGDIPAEAIQNISDPVEALSAVLESFGLDSSSILSDEAGTTRTLSERFPDETQIIPLNPESANTTDINDELRVVENARIVRDVASQWGVEVVFRVGSTTNRGDIWADEGKIFVDTNTVHETINELSDADAKKLMTAKALAQVSVALSFVEHSQNQITELSKETSTKELYNLVDEFYPDESSKAEAKKRLEGTEGDTQAGQEISFLIRQKIANETSLILQGQKVSSLEADIRNRPTFKRQVINFMGRVYTSLVSAKRKHKENPNLSISISNLVEKMKSFRGMPRGPRREKFNPNDPNKTLDTASDMIEAQAPMSDESKVDTSEFKTEKEALAHVAKSDSRFALIAQQLIDSYGDDGLGYKPYDIPEEASPSQILRTFLKSQLVLAGQLPEARGVDPNLKGEELQAALTKMVTDARASDDPKVSADPELDLWEVYLSLVDPKLVTRDWKSQHSFFGFLDRMLSDPWVQSNARQDTVGFTNSWDKFTKAATTILDLGARGGFQKADVLDIIDSSLEDVDFAPQEDPPIGFQPLGTSNANRSTLAKLKAEFGDDPRRHLQQLDDAVSRAQLDWEDSWPPGTKAYSVIEDRMHDGVASLYEAYNKVYAFFGNPVEGNLNRSIELARKEPKFNKEVARLASIDVSDTSAPISEHSSVAGAAFSVGHSAFNAFIDGKIPAIEFWEQYVVQETWSYESLFSKETFEALMELHDLRLDPQNPKPLVSFNADGLPQLSSNIQRIALESKDKDRRQLAWNTLRARRWLSGEDQIEDFTPLGTSNAERKSIEARLAERFGEDPLSSVYSNMATSSVLQRELRTLMRQAARDASDENIRKVNEKRKQLAKAQSTWGKTVTDLFEAFSGKPSSWTLKELREALSQAIWENREFQDYAPQLAEKIWTDAAAGLPEGTDPQISIPISEIKKAYAEPGIPQEEKERQTSELRSYLARPDAPVLVVKLSQVSENETLELVFLRWVAWKALADTASWANDPRALAAADLKNTLEDFLVGKLQYPARALNLSGDDPANAGLKNIAIKVYKVMKFLSGDGISEDPYMNLIGIGWDDLRKIESRLANDLGATLPPRDHIKWTLNQSYEADRDWDKFGRGEPKALRIHEVLKGHSKPKLNIFADRAISGLQIAREEVAKLQAHFGNDTEGIISDMEAVIAGSDYLQSVYNNEIESVAETVLNLPEWRSKPFKAMLKKMGLKQSQFVKRMALVNIQNPSLHQAYLVTLEGEDEPKWVRPTNSKHAQDLLAKLGFRSESPGRQEPGPSGPIGRDYTDFSQIDLRLQPLNFDRGVLKKLSTLGSFTITSNFLYQQDFKATDYGEKYVRDPEGMEAGASYWDATRRAERLDWSNLIGVPVEWQRVAAGGLSIASLPKTPEAGAIHPEWTRVMLGIGSREPHAPFNHTFAGRRQEILTEQSWLREALQSEDPNIRQRAINYLNAFDYLRGPTAKAPDIDLRASGASPHKSKFGNTIQESVTNFSRAAKEALSRTRYGQRKVTAVANQYLFTWYNGDAAWDAMNGVRKKGETYKLDANEILVTAKNWAEARTIAKHLPPLPLYELSSEATRDKTVGMDPTEAHLKKLELFQTWAYGRGSWPEKWSDKQVKEWWEDLIEGADSNIFPFIDSYMDEAVGPTPDIDLRASGASRRRGPLTTGTTFSGGGFVELGLRGITNPAFSLEHDAAIAKAHDKAHGGKTVVDDIRKAAKQLDQIAGLHHHHSSPPCVAASKLQARPSEVSKAEETEFGQIIADAIRKYRNPVFTLENVVDYKDTEAYRLIAEALDDVGYTHDAWEKKVYVAADYGSPTLRRRLMVRATLTGTLPEIKKQPRGNWFDVVEDLVDDLPDATLSRAKNTIIFNGLDAKGIDPFNIKTPILISGYGLGYSGESRASVATASEPAFPLVASTRQFSRIVMPDGRIKRLDARAMARITGVPDDFPLPKDDKLGRTIIGNGVPPPMVLAIFGPLVQQEVAPDIDLRASGASRNRFGVALPHTTKPFDKFIGGLTVAADGTLPKEPLRAQVAKRSGWSREEREMVNAFIDLSPGDRVNATELVKAVELRGSELLETKTRIVSDRMSPAEFDPELADVMNPNRLQHEFETLDNDLEYLGPKQRELARRGAVVVRRKTRPTIGDDAGAVITQGGNLWPPPTSFAPARPIPSGATVYGFELNDKSDDDNIGSLFKDWATSPQNLVERFLSGIPFQLSALKHSTDPASILSDLVDPYLQPQALPAMGFSVHIEVPSILQKEIINSPHIVTELVREIARGRGVSEDVIDHHLRRAPTSGLYVNREARTWASSVLKLLAKSFVSKLQSEGVEVVDLQPQVTGYSGRRSQSFSFAFPIGFTPEQLQADLITLGVRPDVAQLFSEYDRTFPKVADKWEDYRKATKPTISEQAETANPKLPKDMEDFGHSLLYAPEGGMKDQGYFEEDGYKATQLMGWTRHYVDEGVPVVGEDKTPIKGRVVYEVQSQVGQELAKQEKQLRENYGIGIQDVAEDFENWLEGRPLKIKWLADEFLGDDDAAVDQQLPERGLGGLISHSSSDMANADLSDWLTLHKGTWWPEYKEITPQMEKDGYDLSDPGILNPLEAAHADINNPNQEGGLYLHRQIKEVLEKHPELLPSYNKVIDGIKKRVKRLAAQDPAVPEQVGFYPFLIDGQTVRKHPLIRHTDRLSLQLALAEAREAGHSHLMIVDAETAMQVQGHDRQGGDSIRQEAGMRAAYDGKLVDTLVKLTGDKGTRVDLGKGQHTSPIFKNLDGTPKDRVTAIAFAIPDALSMGLFSRQPADPRFPNGFKPLAASGAQRNTNKINSNRAVEILELPVYETGPYKGPGGWMPWNWKIFKGHLDPRLRRLFELRRQYQRYLGAEIRQYKDTMDALIDEEFGGRENAPLELIRLATGSTQGVVLSEEVEEQINSEYGAAVDIIAGSDLPKEVKEEALAKANAKRLERRRLEEGKAAAIIQKDIDYAKDALREQSPAIADHVESLRNMVDELSEQTSRLLGGSVGNEELKIHFDAQMGIYLTRSYRIFSEEGWMDTVLEHEDYSTARDEAIVWFENKFLEERAKSIVNSRNKKPSVKWSKLNDKAKYELALEKAKDELGAKEGLGEDLMKEFLRSYQSETKVVTEGSSESRADIVDSLRRKLSDDELPPYLRTLLGEYGEDTGDFNLMRTFLNVGDLASRQAFLHGMVDMGRSGKQEDWWLLTKKEVEERGLQDDYVAIRDMDRIPARENREGISSFDPLIDFVDEKGNKQGPLYAPKDIVNNFRAFTEPWQPSNKYVKAAVGVTRFLNNLLKQPTGIAMAAMTLGSIPFYIRNVVSNVFFFGPAQGVLFVDPWVFKKAIKEVARVYTTNTERDAARMRMIKLGVLGEDLTVSVWEEMVSGRVSQTQVLAELQRGITEAAKFHSKGLDIPKKILDKLKQTAVACDAFYKIVLYQHELKHLKKAQDYAIKRDPTDALADTDLWTEAKLEEEAAKKVLMVAQSYSQAPPIVRGFTDSAMGNLVAPFFRFKMEVPRIVINTYKLGIKEYSSDNPIIKKRGRNRMVWMSTMLGPVSSLLGEFSKRIFGITDEEEEALRENAPPWAKTQSYFWLRSLDGTPVTINLTYVNPFAMWVDGPLRFAESMLRGKPNEGVKLGLEALWGTPFTEGQIFIKGLGGAMSGKDDYGDEFVSDSDPFLEDMYKRTAYLTSKVFQPPTLKRLFGEFRPGARRPLIAAIEENRKVHPEIDSFLRSPWGIIATEALPFKPRALDSADILNANMSKAKRKKGQADRILNGLKTENPLANSQIQDIAERYVEAVEEYATIALSYENAYKDWGITDRAIRDAREEVLTKAGYKKFLRDGVIKLRGLSKQDISQIKETSKKLDLPQIEERIRLFNQALENRSDEEHKGHIRLPE